MAGSKDGKKDDKKDPSPPREEAAGNGAIDLAKLVLIRNALKFTEKNTGVNSESVDFYQYMGPHYKVPIRQETIGSQPLHIRRIMHFGPDYTADGTISTPINPICGAVVSSANRAALTLGISTEWQGGDWYLSHIGRYYHAIVNSVRAMNIPTADMLKICNALYGYDEICRAIMMYIVYYKMRIEGHMTNILAEVLSSSGGNPMFVSRDDLMGQIINTLQENFFPWPMFDFWLNRGYQAFSLQAPWYKYMLFVPYDLNVFYSGLARIFDSWRSTTKYVHPETYLRGEGLWNIFMTDLVPLLWAKTSAKNYIGGNVIDILHNKGWSALSYDHMQIEWLLNKFWVHPFTETLGIGLNKLPKHGQTDTVTTMKQYYWDSNGKGRQFYINQDSFLFSPKNILSPWLDPTRFIGIDYNYESNDDDASVSSSQCVWGNISYDGQTLSELEYNEWLSLFTRLAFTYNHYEMVEPDADINVNAAIEGASDSPTPNWFELLEYRSKPFSVPFKMPDYHWYDNPRKMYIMYANYLNLKLDDVELYRLQRVRESGVVPSSQSQGNMGRD